MSISGIGYSGILRPQTGATPQGQRGERAAAPEKTSQPPLGMGVAAAMTPAGADGDLWSVLTSEEREFFEKAQALGPVTYGRGKPSADSSIPRGARLDLRV